MAHMTVPNTPSTQRMDLRELGALIAKLPDPQFPGV